MTRNFCGSDSPSVIVSTTRSSQSSSPLWLVLIYKLGGVDTQSVSQLKNGGEVGFDLVRFDID